MIFLIGVGGIAGACARFFIGKWIASRSPTLFPLATLTINISGSFILGLLFSLHQNENIPNWFWLTFGTGFCGAYTTFSTFGYETIQLVEKNRIAHALTYLFTSVVFGILFCWLGMGLIRM